MSTITPGFGRALAVCSALALAGCPAPERLAPTPGLPGAGIGTFVVDVDVGRGTLTVTPLPGGALEAAALAFSGDLVPVPVVQDGVPLQGPPDTVELRTLSSATVPDGCGPGAPSFEAAVRMESFYAGHALLRPHLEVVQLTPVGFESCGGVPSPQADVTDTNGLFAYADIPPLGGATATWNFRLGGATSFRFVARVLAELSERTAPVTAISPAPGTYPAPIVVTLACSDAASGCADTFYSTDGSPPSRPYVGPLSLTAAEPDLCFRSVDVAGNAEETRCASYTMVVPALTATWDATFGAPRCAETGRSCDTGPVLVSGRGALGPEQHAPNAIGGTCPDGTAGAFHRDESLDRLAVTAADGGPLTPGRPARIDATVYAYSATSDTLDLYVAPDAAAPVWTLVASVKPPGTGVQTLSATFTVPAGTTQAIRGNFRYAGFADPCTPGSYDDRDDLVFATGASAPADVAAPTVSLTRPAGGATVSRVALLEASASDDVAVTSVEFYAGGVLVATDAAPPWVASWDTAATSGTTTVYAVARDGAGRSTQSAPVVVTVVDQTPPAVAVTAPAEGARVGGDAVSLAASAADPWGVARVRFLVDGQEVGADDAGPPWTATWDTRAFADGPHAVAVRAMDDAGNVGASAPVAVVLDRTPPTGSLALPLDGDTVTTSLLVRATAADAGVVAQVEFLVDGAVVASDDSAPYEVTLGTSGWAPGPYTLVARVTDSVGNAATTAAVTVTVLPDAAAPTVSVTSPAAGAFVRAAAAAEVAVDAADDRGVARVELWVDGALAGSDAAAPWAVSWTPVAGPHTLEARAYDAAGNEGRSAPVAVTADGLAPAVSLDAPLDGATVSTVVTLGATASDDGAVDRVEFSVDGRLVATSSGAPYAATWDSRTVGNGTRVVAATAYDRAGNSAAASRSVVVRNGTLAAPSGSLSPRCSAPSTACFSGTLLVGHGSYGTEVWPSTSFNMCPDGAGGGYHTSPSVDAIDASSEDGSFIRFGTPMRLEITAWITDPATQRVDLFTDANRSSGDWALVQTFVPAATGRQTFVATFTPTSNRWPVFRASARVGGSAVACTAGTLDDHDELGVFVTDNVNPPSGALTSPLDGATVGGVVTVAAAAQDDTGVLSVRFVLDGNRTLATDTAAPYEIAWNTALEPDGVHTLSCAIEDVSGHTSACAAPVTLSVSNVFTDLATNGGFESGTAGWTVGSLCLWTGDASFPAHGGTRVLRIESSTIGCAAYQTVTLPATGTAQLRFWLDVVTYQTGGSADTLAVTVRDTAGALLATLGTLSNLDAKTYTQRVYDLGAFRGQTVRLQLADAPSPSLPTYFLVDDVQVLVTP